MKDNQFELLMYVVLNVLWFGVFVIGVFFYDWNAWALAVPVLIHFSRSDTKI